MNDFKIGDEVYILETCPDWDDSSPRETYIIRVLNDEPTCMVDKIILGRKYNWYIANKHIRLLTPTIDPKSIKPYPHTCKVCKSPARKYDKMILCSNLKCKVNKIAKAILPKIKKIISVDQEGFVLCPICGNIGTLPYYPTNYISTSHVFDIACRNDHRWPYKANQNDKIKNGQTIYSYNAEKYHWTTQINVSP